MVAVNNEHVVKRLKELRDWADYIVQSLSADQAYERGKLDLLRRMVGNEDLADACIEAKALADRLEQLVSRTEPVPVG
jgi:hypothetical protein